MMRACGSIPILRYEDFTLQPDVAIQRIASSLRLPPPDLPVSAANEVILSGDSGRSGGLISPRPRRPLDQSIISDLNQQLSSNSSDSNYQQLCTLLGYDPAPDTPYPYTIATSDQHPFCLFSPA
jgi:hypothetical protein